MKKTVLISLFILCISLVAGCNAAASVSCNSKEVSQSGYPALKIVTQYEGFIYRVGLVGYSFEDLRMEAGEEKVFYLINGIPGGNDNVNVVLSFRPNDHQVVTTSPLPVNCNFENGKTTTVALKNDYTVTVTNPQ